MKKALSMILAAALGVSALCSSVHAVDTADNGILVLGDSIAAGYTREGYVEHNYGEICADYLGYSYTDSSNMAAEGARTADLLDKLNNDQNAVAAAQNAKVILVSVGGNDVMRRAVKYIFNFVSDKKYDGNYLYKDGFTKDDIPDDPALEDVQKYLDSERIKNYFLSNITQALKLMQYIRNNFCYGTGSYENYIANTIVPNTEAIIDRIREINPDAQIVLQTVYQPFQFSQDIWNNYFSDTEKNMLTELRSKAQFIMNNYKDALVGLAQTKGVKLADVFEEFAAVPEGEEQNDLNQGCAYYFTEIQNGMIPGQTDISITDLISTVDVHPNQKGHLAIAAAVLEQLDTSYTADSTSLMRRVYAGIDRNYNYPAEALETYKNAAGYSIGDVNCDSYVDVRDAALILNHYAATATGGQGTLSAEQLNVSDVNNDGTVNSLDAVDIIEFYNYRMSGSKKTAEDYFGTAQNNDELIPYYDSSFTVEEIAASEYKPDIKLTAGEINDGKFTLKVEISNMDAASAGFALNYDRSAFTLSGKYTGSYFTLSDTEKGSFITFCNDVNVSSETIELEAAVSDSAEGKYTISTEFGNGSVLTNLEDDEKGRLQQAYAASKTSSVEISVDSGEEPTEPPTDAPTGAPTEPPTDAPTGAPTEPPTDAPTDAPTETPTGYELGDINDDGAVDAVDASYILTAYALKATTGSTGLTDEAFTAGDVNEDGNVDAVDASLVLTYYADKQSGKTTEDFDTYIKKLI